MMSDRQKIATKEKQYITTMVVKGIFDEVWELPLGLSRILGVVVVARTAFGV